jgi:DNA-binding NarL/FixJ family response regulator
MRVVLADGEPDVRWALRLLLIYDVGMQVVGEVADASELWAQLQEARPDLLLLDWSLFGAGVGAALARLRADYPLLHVIVLSGYPEAGRAALAAGADAFVSKADLPEQMVRTLNAVSARNGSDHASGRGDAATEGADG